MSLLAGLLALAVGCLLGWLGRYFLIEPTAIQSLCAAGTAPAWCAPRELLITVTFGGWWGRAAVASALLGWVVRRRAAAACALVALFTGGLGLFLYDATWAASGVLAALLRLPRIVDEPPDPREFSA